MEGDFTDEGAIRLGKGKVAGELSVLAILHGWILQNGGHFFAYCLFTRKILLTSYHSQLFPKQLNLELGGIFIILL